MSGPWPGLSWRCRFARERIELAGIDRDRIEQLAAALACAILYIASLARQAYYRHQNHNQART